VGGLREALPRDSSLQKQVDAMERTIDRTMLEMRALLLELRPIALEGAGLVPALRELCLTYETRLGSQVISEIPASLAELRLAPEVEHTVLRVVQEAFSNAVRHSGCSKISLRLTADDGCLNVTVEDDGIGYDQARSQAKRGMGLEVMRERVGELGGTITVTGQPGQGTVVHMSIPGDAR
jgi:signal transduction histidine kinase